jgi:hypothetical protein
VTVSLALGEEKTPVPPLKVMHELLSMLIQVGDSEPINRLARHLMTKSIHWPPIVTSSFLATDLHPPGLPCMPSLENHSRSLTEDDKHE